MSEKLEFVNLNFYEQQHALNPMISDIEMTSFGEWLGESNGKTMLADIGKQHNITKEQFRAAITTYCILFDVNVDTSRWDELMHEMFHGYNSWFNNFAEFDMYMCKLLV